MVSAFCGALTEHVTADEQKAMWQRVRAAFDRLRVDITATKPKFVLTLPPQSASAAAQMASHFFLTLLHASTDVKMCVL
jgi:hypothetical protein